MGTDRVRPQDPQQESEQARTLAARYRCEFVDLANEHIDHELFRSIPVDLMFRYNFVPIEGHNGTLEIALAAAQAHDASFDLGRSLTGWVGSSVLVDFTLNGG